MLEIEASYVSFLTLFVELYIRPFRSNIPFATIEKLTVLPDNSPPLSSSSSVDGDGSFVSAADVVGAPQDRVSSPMQEYCKHGNVVIAYGPWKGVESASLSSRMQNF